MSNAALGSGKKSALSAHQISAPKDTHRVEIGEKKGEGKGTKGQGETRCRCKHGWVRVYGLQDLWPPALSFLVFPDVIFRTTRDNEAAVATGIPT